MRQLAICSRAQSKGQKIFRQEVLVVLLYIRRSISIISMIERRDCREHFRAEYYPHF